jgi:hypothetical protein
MIWDRNGASGMPRAPRLAVVDGSLMRTLVTIFFLLALAACNGISMFGTASVVATDKTLSDHAVSYFSGKDCYTVRKETGRSYCKEDERNPTPTVHCYRNLGGVTCYEKQNPYNDRRKEIGTEGYELHKQE